MPNIVFFLLAVVRSQWSVRPTAQSTYHEEDRNHQTRAVNFSKAKPPSAPPHISTLVISTIPSTTLFTNINAMLLLFSKLIIHNSHTYLI